MTDGAEIRDSLGRGLTSISQWESVCRICGGSIAPGVWIHRPYGSREWVHQMCAAREVS